MKNAVVYIRVRTDNNEQTALIDKQLDACKKFAANSGYSVVHTYIEHEILGVLSERTVWTQLLMDSKSRSWNAVIVYSIDRISRNFRYLKKYRTQLERNGKALLIVYGNESDINLSALMGVKL